MRRKNIALFTAQPESSHEVRILKGIAEQCYKYDYNLLVFSPMTHLQDRREAFVRAEADIYKLADLSGIDGLILDSVNLMSGQGVEVLDVLKKKLKDHPDLPVVSLEMSIDGIPDIKNKNENSIRQMCRHAIDVHGKKEICILTGMKDNEVAEERLAICLDEIERHGLTVKKEHIYYGNFWYNSGDDLARDIVSGKISRPDAVLCTSTHMALGLIYRLDKEGIRVPEDICVIGFDTTDEGRCNEITLSSFDAADTSSSAEAVDYIRKILEPDKEILPYEEKAEDLFFRGMSCGCEPDFLDSMKTMRTKAYFTAHNYSADVDLPEVDFGRFMESYCLEEFTASLSPADCIGKMGEMVYLLHPFINYYLCLKKDWLENDREFEDGYPGRMGIVLSGKENKDGSFSADTEIRGFDTSEMIPVLKEPSEEASVFYFSPIHFEGITMGYSVLQRPLKDSSPLTLVYRTWLRFVNNALEMTRAKRQLFSMSMRDGMTGLYNRRGMENKLEKMLDQAKAGDKLYVAVIDMDGLKKVNDTYGHTEGDRSILTISRAVLKSSRDNEICVRAGGDEFYIMGVGEYPDDMIETRIKEFNRNLQDLSAMSYKPYTLTASMGCALENAEKNMNIDAVLGRADEQMYKAKTEAKRHRE